MPKGIIGRDVRRMGDEAVEAISLALRTELAAVSKFENRRMMRWAALGKRQTDHGVTVDARYLENEIGALMPERE